MVKLLEARYAKHPSDTKTAMDLADAYLMTEQPAKARRLYTKVLASDPGNETAKVQLAMALHADGRDPRLSPCSRASCRPTRTASSPTTTSPSSTSSSRSPSEARNEWRKAAAIDPTSAIGKSAQNFVNLMDDSTGGPHPSSGKGS